MKNLILFTTTLLVIMTLSSCGDIEPYPRYKTGTGYATPDSLLAKRSQFIVDVVKAASPSGLGGDYEDVDDTIDEAEDVANRLFRVEVRGLWRKDDHNSYSYFIAPKDFSPKEVEIYKQLTNQ